MKNDTLVLDTRVNGYAGQPTRLVATYNVATGNLYISAEKPFNPIPKKRSVLELLKLQRIQARTLIITDSADSLAKWDLLYRESDHLTEVVRCYHEKKRNNLITIDPKVQGRYNPDSVLQARKLDVKAGALWELSTETENGHICILLACWGAMRATNNFSFTAQLEQDLSQVHNEPDSFDLDEPFTL